MPKSQEKHPTDIYIPGFDGSVLGSQTIIDIVRTHTHNKQGEVSATTGAHGPRRPTARAQAVKAAARWGLSSAS